MFNLKFEGKKKEKLKDFVNIVCLSRVTTFLAPTGALGVKCCPCVCLGYCAMKGSKTDLEGLRVFLKRELKRELKRFSFKKKREN